MLQTLNELNQLIYFFTNFCFALLLLSALIAGAFCFYHLIIKDKDLFLDEYSRAAITQTLKKQQEQILKKLNSIEHKLSKDE